MIDSILMVLGEIFLDTVINHSFDSSISKKKRIFATCLFLLIVVLYLSLFGLLATIAITLFYDDRSTSIKLFLTCLLLLIVFLVYGYRIISKWKQYEKDISKLK